jgi:hypothetical protein
MSIDSDFGRLQGADPETIRDRQIQALLAHARNTSKRIDDLTCATSQMQTMLAEMSGHLKAQREELADNTEITQSVRDAVTAGRVAGHLIKWAGVIAAAISAVYGAWWAVTHIGHPPGG